MKKLLPVIHISPDAMQAVLELPFGADTELTPETIDLALKQAEVFMPVPEQTIQEIVRLHQAGKKVSGTALAFGTPPRAAVAGEIISSGNLNLPVFPGDQFGELKPAIPAKSGINVKGELLYPPNAEKSVANLRLSPNKTVVEVKGVLVALRYGLVSLENNEISIHSLLRLSEDLMELSGQVYPVDYLGQKITVTKMVSAVRAMGLRARPNTIMLEEALEKAYKTQKPIVDITICKGLKPFQGEDGWLEIKVAQEQQQQAGAIDASGNIDYKNRGVVQTVKAEQVVARLHPPGKGRPGRNLLGDSIEGMDGTPFYVRLGENVGYGPNGQDIIAKTGGLFSFINNQISISEVFVINEDVSLRTGHIALERGSIEINGSVLSGFHVTCPGSIIIRGTVEDAILTAGGDIFIDGGVVMNNNGFIRAFGSVRALFAIGSSIHAGENVQIANEVNKSTIVAEGNILVSGGKGKVVGGLLHSGKSIEVNQLGSEMGAATNARLGVDESFMQEYQSEQVRLSKSLDFIQEKLGPGEDEEIISHYPEDKLATVKHILTIRTQLKNRVNQLDNSIIRLEKQMHAPNNYVLKVRNTLYAGVTINCQNVSFPVHSPLRHCKIIFDSVKRQFLVSGI